MAEPILVGKRLERFWRQRIRNAGFNPEPFALKTNRSVIHPPQYVAAMTVFYGMYCVKAEERVAWVHLVAEMQAGKTGVCDALARLIWRNVEDGKMPVDLFHNIFVITGLSDRTWVRQTRQRLPAGVHVHHSPTLKEMQVRLKKLAEHPDGLQNILIIVDESHVASAKKNRPYKHIYSEVRTHLPDPREWAGRNVTFLTVSATDPHAVLMMGDVEDLPTKVVALETTEGYQSVESLKKAGRIRYFDNIGSTPESIVELRTAVESYETPRYHILRAEGKLNGTTVDLLKSEFPEARVRTWDAETKKVPGDASTSGSTEEDINELLSTAPEVTTFIVIKRMFSCAKTMVDTHVGVLWDYVSVWDDKDSVRLQSLLGRACGYGRSKDTVVYTSEQVVESYVKEWRDAMRSVERMAEAKTGNWRNVGVTSDRDGKPMRMANRSTPIAPPGPPEPPKAKFDDEDFACDWYGPFNSLEEAKAGGWGRNGGGGKPNGAGFYRNRLPGKKTPMTEAEIGRVRASKKTWLAAPPHGKDDFEVGAPAQANFVYYVDPTDPTTARFVYKVVTRQRAARPDVYGPAAAGGGRPE